MMLMGPLLIWLSCVCVSCPSRVHVKYYSFVVLEFVRSVPARPSFDVSSYTCHRVLRCVCVRALWVIYRELSLLFTSTLVCWLSNEGFDSTGCDCLCAYFTVVFWSYGARCCHFSPFVFLAIFYYVHSNSGSQSGILVVTNSPRRHCIAAVLSGDSGNDHNAAASATVIYSRPMSKDVWRLEAVAGTARHCLALIALDVQQRK